MAKLLLKESNETVLRRSSAPFEEILGAQRRERRHHHINRLPQQGLRLSRAPGAEFGADVKAIDD